MLSLIFAVEREWQATETRKFGVGDISSAGGKKMFGHDSHKRGLEVDIRPLRMDGEHIPCTYQEKAYDRTATEKLIYLFRLLAPGPLLIFFNDLKITGVRPLDKHAIVIVACAFGTSPARSTLWTIRAHTHVISGWL